MLSFLPSPILFVFNLIVLSVVTFILSLPILIAAIIRAILPFKFVVKVVDLINYGIFRAWIAHNALLIRLTNKIEYDIEGADIDKIKGSCIIISNHLSWADIVMLNHLYRGKIPITKFFLKQSLIYIPVLGLVCYSIGMPFLKRYDRQQLLKNPALKNKDIDATKKACMSLLTSPSSLVNFVEGTRYTKQKAKVKQSPYRHLMPPKAASLAVALGIIGDKIDGVYNTTMLYPHVEGNIFLTLLKGRLKHFVARIEVIEGERLQSLCGDYLNDKAFKRKFTQDLKDIWQQKDDQIHEILKKYGLASDETLPKDEAQDAQAAAPAATAAPSAELEKQSEKQE